MTDKKLTDEEIIALTTAYTDRKCGKCAIMALRIFCGSCFIYAIKESLSLINRQKAEIEALKIANQKQYEVNTAQAKELDDLAEEHSDLIVEKDQLFDMVVKQKAEIERLRSMNQAKLDIIHDLQTELETAKAEAIKEFAERLEASCDAPHWCVWLSEIDQIAKELTNKPNNADRCVVCGEIVPEGRQVCPRCEKGEKT